MIHHVVMWRLRNEGRITALSTFVTEQLQRNIEDMRRKIPGLLRLQIGINQSKGPDAADLILYSEFESWHALQAYEGDPLHDELRALIKPLRNERRVINYET